MQDKYVDALLKERRLRDGYLDDANTKTIYIGGGTPSLLSEGNIRKISEAIYQEGVTEEFTIECNPDDVTPELCKTLHECGVNRVSMGVQTFADERLRFLNRRHTAKDIPAAIENLHNNDIHNISIDLMFGFPNESLEEWKEDLTEAITLDVKHISAYSLMYEEGTRLYKMLEKGEIQENDESVSVAMYDTLIDTLTSHGYEHYEISNFAKPGFRSMHNSSYWNGTQYIGLGAAAHSFNTVSRQWNVSDVREYIESIVKDVVPAETEHIDETTRYNDMITTALRTREGIDLNKLSAKEHSYILRSATNSLNAGTLAINDNRLHLTRKGLYISDDVMSDLIMV